jgi:uncharacterized protein YndB with AHSA1/START domain
MAMQTLHFSIVINAPKEKVWKAMLDDATYREWTGVFMPGSHYVGTWDAGSEIQFLGPDEDGKMGGMLSKVAENRPNEFLSLEHMGVITDGVADTTGEEALVWKGAHENYTLNDKDGGTELVVDTDTDEDNRSIFAEGWPRALQKLKEIAESAA